MGVTSYPTPLDSTSTDIDAVGGKDAFIGMQREDKDGNRYVLFKVKSGSTVTDGKWVTAEFGSGLELAVGQTVPCVGGNTTGKTVTTGQYFWCMVYGYYDMDVSSNVDSAYRRIKADNGGSGTAVKVADNDLLTQVHSCGLSLEAYGARVSGKARCLIDPRSGY
jgi:hypothetical protein